MLEAKLNELEIEWAVAGGFARDVAHGVSPRDKDMFDVGYRTITYVAVLSASLYRDYAITTHIHLAHALGEEL